MARAGRAEEFADVLARAERAEAALETARAERAEELADALARAERAEKASDEATHRADNELNNARVAEEKQRELEADLSTLERRLHTVTLLVSGAEERAENAEEIARRSDAKAAEMETAAREAQEKVIASDAKLTEVEKAVKAAEERAAKAEDFRKSESYAEELAEASAFSYTLGFQDCKEMVGKVFGDLPGLGDLEPEGAAEEAIAEPVPTDNDLAPTVP